MIKWEIGSENKKVVKKRKKHLCKYLQQKMYFWFNKELHDYFFNLIIIFKTKKGILALMERVAQLVPLVLHRRFHLQPLL
jgi:hypothetical protein